MSYRVGIVGSGFGGLVHAPAYKLHPDFELVAIASPHRAAAVAAERGIPHAFDDVDAMLAGVDLDVVSVASPPVDHARSVRAALAAGKAVLAEKPFTLTLAEAEALAADVRASGIPNALAFEFRYYSAERALRELVVNDHLGPLRQIEMTIFSTMLRADATDRARGWWFTRAAGGGVANAFGPHAIDLACWLAGRAPVATHGTLRTANVERHDAQGSFTNEVADGMFAILDFGAGLTARVTVDATLAISQSSIAAHGERRTAVAAGAWLTELELYTVDADEQDEYDLAPIPHAKHAAIHANLPGFMGLLDAFAARLRNEPSDVPTFDDGLRAQRVLDALGYGTRG